MIKAFINDFLANVTTYPFLKSQTAILQNCSPLSPHFILPNFLSVTQRSTVSSTDELDNMSSPLVRISANLRPVCTGQHLYNSAFTLGKIDRDDSSSASKGCNICDLNIYRPIANLSWLSKVLETFVGPQLHLPTWRAIVSSNCRTISKLVCPSATSRPHHMSH